MCIRIVQPCMSFTEGHSVVPLNYRMRFHALTFMMIALPLLNLCS